jgi:hypothetical protein
MAGAIYGGVDQPVVRRHKCIGGRGVCFGDVVRALDLVVDRNQDPVSGGIMVRGDSTAL